MHYVYILECADRTLYTGYTTDVERRLKEHNNSKCGAHYTKIHRPVILKHKEAFRTLGKALRREAEIKKMKRGEKVLLIAKKYGKIKNIIK